jgi:hypothetical protein
MNSESASNAAGRSASRQEILRGAQRVDDRFVNALIGDEFHAAGSG